MIMVIYTGHRTSSKLQYDILTLMLILMMLTLTLSMIVTRLMMMTDINSIYQMETSMALAIWQTL